MMTYQLDEQERTDKKVPVLQYCFGYGIASVQSRVISCCEGRNPSYSVKIERDHERDEDTHMGAA